jgi:hypothetical protein
MQNKFGFDLPPRNDLFFQIAEAVKEWRISTLEYDRLLAEWHNETDEHRKEVLWKEYNLSQKINEGNLAQVQLLADRYIKEQG